jgi:hypothetical protein
MFDFAKQQRSKLRVPFREAEWLRKRSKKRELVGLVFFAFLRVNFDPARFGPKLAGNGRLERPVAMPAALRAEGLLRLASKPDLLLAVAGREVERNKSGNACSLCDIPEAMSALDEMDGLVPPAHRLQASPSPYGPIFSQFTGYNSARQRCSHSIMR